MPRETIEAKAMRYLAEGRLYVHTVRPGEVAATCRGNDRYRLGWNGSWWCNCPARIHCAHIFALQLVTVPDRNVGDTRAKHELSDRE
ncbi:MAG TPA: hypothetical protein VH063_06520 [Gaiellaceae bacterium]|jgi:uncharacterized Zn finger protein|nr:hypothetical protein [Gaiellaceae bacterium]